MAVPDGLTIDLPAWQAEDDWHSGVITDALSTPDTSTEIVMETDSFSLGIGYFAAEEHLGGGYPNLVYMPATPDGYELTGATYVAIAYREAADPSGSWPDDYGPPTAFPFLYADSSGTSDFHSFFPLPVGGYDGEMLSIPDSELLSRLTATPGSQLPANRLWVGRGTGTPSFIHVAYYAIRLTYTSIPPTAALVPVATAPEDCLIPLRRSLHQVQFNSGPTVTAKYELSTGGNAWNVTFSGIAQEPWEFGQEVPVIHGFGDPNVNDPWVGGLPDHGVIDLDGAIYTEKHCDPTPLAPLEDPLCPATLAPPLPPSVGIGCFELPANWRRRQITIPASYVPLWGDVVPKFEVHARHHAVRYLRLRFYADPDGDGDISDDPCAFCADIVISYIPAGFTLVFDTSQREVYVIDGTQRRRRADSVVSSADGSPFDWPVLTCGMGYIVTLDLPQTQKPPVFDLSFFARVP